MTTLFLLYHLAPLMAQQLDGRRSLTYIIRGPRMLPCGRGTPKKTGKGFEDMPLTQT